jgi:hypothetical protein
MNGRRADTEVILNRVQPIIFGCDLPFRQYKLHYLVCHNCVDLLLVIMNV